MMSKIKKKKMIVVIDLSTATCNLFDDPAGCDQHEEIEAWVQEQGFKLSEVSWGHTDNHVNDFRTNQIDYKALFRELAIRMSLTPPLTDQEMKWHEQGRNDKSFFHRFHQALGYNDTSIEGIMRQTKRQIDNSMMHDMTPEMREKFKEMTKSMDVDLQAIATLLSKDPELFFKDIKPLEGIVTITGHTTLNLYSGALMMPIKPMELDRFEHEFPVVDMRRCNPSDVEAVIRKFTGQSESSLHEHLRNHQELMPGIQIVTNKTLNHNPI